MNTERSTSTLDTPTPSDDAPLPDDVLTLQAMIRELLDALKKKQDECEGVQQRLDLLLRKLYGPKAERFDPSQPWLLPEMAPNAAADPEPSPPVELPSEESPSNGRVKKRNGGGRKKLPENLPRVRKEHTLPEARVKGGVNNGFLKLILESPKYQDSILADAGGSTIKHIYISKIDKMLVAVPKDPTEQENIKTRLLAQSNLLHESELQLMKLGRLKTALMQDLLTGRRRVTTLLSEPFEAQQ